VVNALLELTQHGDGAPFPTGTELRCRSCSEPIELGTTILYESPSRPWLVFHRACVREVCGEPRFEDLAELIDDLVDQWRSWDAEGRRRVESELIRLRSEQQRRCNDATVIIDRVDATLDSMKAQRAVRQDPPAAGRRKPKGLRRQPDS